MKRSVEQMQMFGLSNEEIELPVKEKKPRLSEEKVIVSLLQKVTEQLLVYKKQLLQQVKPQLIDLAILLCEKVIRQQLSNPQALAKMIDSVLLAEMGSIDDEKVFVVLCPEDLILLKESHNLFDFGKKIQFISDPQLNRSDVRIETKDTMINATIIRQLQTLRSKMIDT